MKLKFEFKGTKSNLMNQETVPSICMHQQMIISTFYILGLSSKPFSTSFHWHFDSLNFNYMINIAYYLTNIHNYTNNLKIYTVDGNQLPIMATSDMSPIINAFVSFSFNTNLILAGQLIDNDCNMKFSKSGCVM
jgi:hypothetical protein